MAESYFDKRRKELGISHSATVEKTPATDDYFQRRKMDLGVIPDTRQKEAPKPSVNMEIMQQTPGIQSMSNPQGVSGVLERRGQQAVEENRPTLGPLNPTNIQPEQVADPRTRKEIDAYRPYSGTPASAADQFVSSMGNALMLGIPNQQSGGMLEERNNSAAGVAGSLVGDVLLGGGAYGLTKNIARNALSNAPKIVQNIARGALAGATYGGAQEAADALMDTRMDGDNSIGERLGRVGIDAALFAAGDAAATGLGMAVRRGLQAIRERPLNNAIKDFIQKVELPSSNLGIVASPKRARAYDNLRNDTKSQLVTKTRKPESSTRSKLTKGYEYLTDDLYTLKNFDKYAENILGDIQASKSTYIPAITSRGSDIVSKQILTDKMVNAQGDVIGNSLKDILSKVPKGKQVDFEDYLINKHAITRYDRGEQVFRDELNWNPQAGAQKIAEYESQFPEFKQIADEYYQFRRDLAKNWLVDSGLIPENVFNSWIQENPFYVPMKRQFTELEKRGQRAGAQGRFGNQSAPVKKYSPVGSQRKIISPIESTIEDVDAMVKASKRNTVMQNLVETIRRDPESFKEWAEIIPVKSEAKQTSIKEINDILQTDGIDGLVSRLNDDFEVAYKKSARQGLDKDNVIRTMINGEPVHIRVNDPQLLDAIGGLTPQAQNMVMRGIANTTRIVKLLTTGANPVFSLTRNMFRDIPMAYIASKSTNNPIRFGVDLVEGFVSALSNGKLYRSFKNVGGGHASAVAADRNLLAQSKREILGNKTVRDRLGSVIGAIENFNNALEAAPRLGEFKRLTKIDDFENRIKALYEANDITVNFKRRGRVSRQLDPVILYWNASVQGLDKAMRIFKDNPVQATAKATAAITVPTIVLYALNHNNPQYQETSEYQKDNFFLIPTGNKENPFVRIPKPQVLGIPFSTLPERALRQWNDQDPEAFREFATTVINQFLPAGVSGVVQDVAIEGRIPDPFADTIFGPFSDIRSNKNFFGGSIVPGYLEGVSPRLQYDSKTSEISKYIGDKLNVSPKQLDHLIKSYTGVIGQLGIPATAQGSTLVDTLIKQVTVDPTYSNNLMDRFYTDKEKQDRMYSDMRQTGTVPEGYNDGLRKFYNRVSSAMSDIRKQMRAVEQDKSLSSQEKKDTSRELQKMLNNLAREALKARSDAP